LWFGFEQPTKKVINLRGVNGQESKAGMELLAKVLIRLGLFVGIEKQRVKLVAIGSHVLHDGRDFIRFGIQQSVT
jgi:hypothetical protein